MVSNEPIKVGDTFIIKRPFMAYKSGRIVTVLGHDKKRDTYAVQFWDEPTPNLGRFSLLPQYWDRLDGPW